ncbi:Oidioi.mRNA.OKI2018_I69.XSR.g14288.t1.cds [Oikopleura dioica]|uniref:Oidioi.mRNA.OKI2018_I69.XSR.g14288.t1.cds n=1 Tax=Oikopleura dioica TaxID=34765 RepID=A0ABN7SE98_OIKDI|nr:Oidioi.mRNA.OKI2018_I69.XSR.g14288.t1.cds [Oikopleura dioica]
MRNLPVFFFLLQTFVLADKLEIREEELKTESPNTDAEILTSTENESAEIVASTLSITTTTAIVFFIPGCIIGFFVVYGSQCPEEKLEGPIGYAVLGGIGFVLALLLLIGSMTNCGQTNEKKEQDNYSSSLDETIGEDEPSDPYATSVVKI